MGATFELDWKGAEYLKKVEAAAENGLATAAAVLAGIMAKSIQASITVEAGTAVRDQPASPAGTPPASKTGRLAGSMTSARIGRLKHAAGTNVEYARIQEFGGTINHPGGTAYIVVGPGKAKFIKNSEVGQYKNVKRTKPHPITLPARPFMRPALNNNKAAIVKAFNSGFKKRMAVSR